jgi:hypothetical protein
MRSKTRRNVNKRKRSSRRRSVRRNTRRRSVRRNTRRRSVNKRRTRRRSVNKRKRSSTRRRNLRGGADVEPPTGSPFLCPMSLEVMTDPVVTADGHTYERAGITRWLFGPPSPHTTSPKTGGQLENKTLITNHALKQLIDELNAGKLLYENGMRYLQEIAQAVIQGKLAGPAPPAAEPAPPAAEPAPPAAEPAKAVTPVRQGWIDWITGDKTAVAQGSRHTFEDLNLRIGEEVPEGDPPNHIFTLDNIEIGKKYECQVSNGPGLLGTGQIHEVTITNIELIVEPSPPGESKMFQIRLQEKEEESMVESGTKITFTYLTDTNPPSPRGMNVGWNCSLNLAGVHIVSFKEKFDEDDV